MNEIAVYTSGVAAETAALREVLARGVVVGRLGRTVSGLARWIRDAALDEEPALPADEGFWTVMHAMRGVPAEGGAQSLREHYRRAHGVQSAINALKQARLEVGQVVSLAREAERGGDPALAGRIRRLAGYYGSYEDALKREGALDDVGAIRAAARIVEKRRLPGVDRIVLKGFFNFTPVQTELFRACRQAGIEVLYEVPFHPGYCDLRGDAELWKKVEAIGATVVPAGVREVEKTAASCPTVRDELALAAREIKRRILESGLRPWNAAVFLRRLEGRVEEAAGVFEEHGLPVSVTGTAPVSRDPAVRFLLAAFKVGENGYPRREVIGLAWHPYVGGGEAGVRASRVADLQEKTRAARLLEGAERWDSLLSGEPDQEPVRAFLRRLREAERPAPVHERIRWVQSLVPPGTREAELRGVAKLVEHLRRYQRWDGKATWTRDEFFENMRKLADELTMEAGAEGEAAGVLITTPEQGAGIERPFAAVLGLTEGQFPIAPEESAGALGLVLTTGEQEDFNRLAGREVFLERASHYRNERRLFAACLGTPSRWCLLSTNTFEGEREALASSYWIEWKAREGAAERILTRRKVFLPDWDDVWTPAQAAVAGSAGRGGAAASRGTHEEFSRFEGMLNRGETLGRVSDLGASPGRPLSPTDLETYGQCPYKFFAQRILRIEEVKEPEGDIAPIDVGSLLHDVLSAASAEMQKEKKPWSGETLKDAVNRALQRMFDETEKTWPSPPIYWNLMKERIRSILPRVAEAEGRRIQQSGLTPFAWERELRGVVDSGPQSRVHLKARADRLDRGDGGAVFVTDYKWSALTSLRPVNYRSLQLPLYVLLAAEENETPFGYGWYVSLSRPGTLVPKTTRSSAADWVARAKAWLRLYVPAIRKGFFPPLPGEEKDREHIHLRFTPEECGFCPYPGMCRIRDLEGEVKKNPLAGGGQPQDL